MKALITCGLLVLLASPGLALTHPWVFPGLSWDESKTPEDLGMLRSKLDEFRVNLNTGSTGCVIKNGYLVYSWGATSAQYDWFSASKPCLSTMLFAAMREGRVASPDSLISPYWPGLRVGDSTMTFRHLADMMSGYASSDYPGARWAYNDYGIMLYADTLDRVFGTNDTLATAGHRLFVVPLQFEDGILFGGPQGHVQASARDYARMAWLWLNRGNWNGTQLLPSLYFDNYVKADVPLDTPQSTEGADDRDDYLHVGSYGGGINQHAGAGIYGFNWWFNQSLTLPPRNPPLLACPSAPADTYFALGRWGYEAVVVFPSLGMVVAAFNPFEPIWGDVAITDPPTVISSLNHNLTLLADAVRAAPPTPPVVIYPDANVMYAGEAINAVSLTTQINWGLAAFGGLAGDFPRSYLEFHLGTAPVASAHLKLYDYWGGPTYNGEGALPWATTRLEGTRLDAPVQIVEPAADTVNPAWVPPAEADFVAIGSDLTVGPFIGWYEWDITGWYNARLDQTTTLVLRGAAFDGYDFPIFEDREGTAYKAGAGGSAANTGPRLECYLASLESVKITQAEAEGGQFIMSGTGGPSSAGFYLLSSTDPTLPVAEWRRVSTHQFDSTGKFSVSTPMDAGVSQMFLRLQLH